MPEVAVAQVVEDSVVLYKDYPGYLEAASKADVVGEVSGKLLTKNYTPGSFVQKGQLLFTIDPSTYRDAVAQANSQLSSARSQRDYYAQQAAAMQRAFEQDAVSKMELLQSQSSLRQAEASIRSAEASLHDAQTKLAKCSVRAPISGYISESTLSPGNYVNGEAAPQTLATIYDNSTFKARFSIEDAAYGNLLEAQSEGGAALFSNMPLKFQNKLPHQYFADLYYEAPSVSQSTGGLTLFGTVKNQNNELKDGMYLLVSLPTGVSAHALLVKDAAISTDQLGKYLYVVNDSDKVVYTPITVGQLYHDSLRVVEKGLKPGDRYVTEALLTVRPGMRISPRLTH